MALIRMLAVGDLAPDFTLPRDGGGTVSLATLGPDPVVLFFYPADDTPGCTTEAQEFSARMTRFRKAGAQVFGISRDSVASHDRFVAKRYLTTPLLSDEDGAVCAAYGVWGEKTNFGKTYMGVRRTTFLIGSEGRILHIWPVLAVRDHAAAVLAAVLAL